MWVYVLCLTTLRNDNAAMHYQRHIANSLKNSITLSLCIKCEYTEKVQTNKMTLFFPSLQSGKKKSLPASIIVKADKQLTFYSHSN